MIREVNLLGHLPSYIQEYREIQGVMKAEEPELQLVEDDSERIKDNMFILHTDELGIKRFESMFGLIPPKNASLSERQIAVLAKHTNAVTYTLQGLIDRLNVICGADNYTLEINPKEYLINIELHPKVDNLLDAVSSMLVNVLPANMLHTCAVRCNRHRMLAVYPQYLLKQFTHEELYDAKIDDHISASCDNIANRTAETIESLWCEHVLNFGMRKV